MEKQKVVLAGGSGFLGRHLRQHFEALGYQVVTLGRGPAGAGQVAWDGRTLGPWATELEGAALLVNLAGRTVDCRYTAANRAAILRSRLDSTRVLGAAVAACHAPPAVWLQVTTATIYAHTTGDAPANTEAGGVIGNGFSVGVATAWEDAFWACPVSAQTRRAALRTAIVLGPDGGAFPVMARLARRGLCSPQGSGQQWISWLHVADFCRAVEFLALHADQTGTFNLCAPQPLLNRAFNNLLQQHFRPWLCLPQPAWLLEVGAFFLRTETELILKSRKVYPQRLLEAGFTFAYPTAAAAVADLLPAV